MSTGNSSLTIKIIHMSQLKITDQSNCHHCPGTEILHLYNDKGECTYICSDCLQPVAGPVATEETKKKMRLHAIGEFERMILKFKKEEMPEQKLCIAYQRVFEPSEFVD